MVQQIDKSNIYFINMKKKLFNQKKLTVLGAWRSILVTFFVMILLHIILISLFGGPLLSISVIKKLGFPIVEEACKYIFIILTVKHTCSLNLKNAILISSIGFAFYENITNTTLLYNKMFISLKFIDGITYTNSSVYIYQYH